MFSKKKRKMFKSFYFLFPLALFLTMPLLALDHYQRSTVLIPWGEGKSKIPVVIDNWKFKGVSHTTFQCEEGGTDYFDVDNEGDFYVMYQYPKGKSEISGVKAFDQSGKEIAAWEPPPLKYRVFRSMAVSGDRVYVTDDIDNKILEFDKKLNLLKEINVPKSYAGGIAGCPVGQGMIHAYGFWDPADTKGRFVFDSAEWEKNGKPDFLDYPRRQIKVQAHGPKAGDASTIVVMDVYQNKKGKWQKNLLFSINEKIGSISSGNDRIRVGHTETVGIDGEKNIYISLVIEHEELISPPIYRLIKVNSRGVVLSRIDKPAPNGGITKFKINKNGTVYVCGYDSKGFQINVWTGTIK